MRVEVQINMPEWLREIGVGAGEEQSERPDLETSWGLTLYSGPTGSEERRLRGSCPGPLTSEGRSTHLSLKGTHSLRSVPSEILQTSPVIKTSPTQHATAVPKTSVVFLDSALTPLQKSVCLLGTFLLFACGFWCARDPEERMR